MKFAVLASLIATAAAFAPAKQATTSTTLKAFEDELGAQAPLGFFDPLGLVADGNESNFDRLRYVEIKHGRIAMLAVVGYLVTEAGIRLPGNIDFSGTKFSDIPSGFDAVSSLSSGALLQLFGFIGFLEVFVMKDITGGEFVGDFRNDFIDYGWETFDEETQMTKRAVELNQGRVSDDDDDGWRQPLVVAGIGAVFMLLAAVFGFVFFPHIPHIFQSLLFVFFSTGRHDGNPCPYGPREARSFAHPLCVNTQQSRSRGD